MEEARYKFRTKINATINEAKSCKSDTNLDAEEIQRERQLASVEMEGGLYYLLG